VKNRNFLLGALIILSVAFTGLSLQGCQGDEPTDLNTTSWVNHVEESTPTHISTINPGELDTEDEKPTRQPDEGDQHLPTEFPPPSIAPATPIPPPVAGMNLGEDILVWVLLGSDTEPPFTGRTQAIHLLFIHPRFSKASLVSIPGDLYVYIPGFTMQRINTAYAVGGIETLRMTLAYNFGVVPSRFVLAHPGDFQWLVDDLNGIEVTVFRPMPQACGSIRAGLIRMDGTLALCYASYREGIDEIDRMQRQQQLLQIIFRQFTQDGNLIQLPVLFTSYQGWVKTDFALAELMAYIPLALRLGDINRVGYFMIGWDQFSIWEVPGYSQALVFLPDQDGIRSVLQEAIDFISTPIPYTNQVQTLEAQLTAAHQATATDFIQATPIPTLTPMPSATSTGTYNEITPLPTATITPPGYP
jgi:polyisoprenyl-teichoic acid--peptidoglycan teichoic acid transferase